MLKEKNLKIILCNYHEKLKTFFPFIWFEWYTYRYTDSESND